MRAGTIFAGSSTSLRKWFLAIYLITQSKNDIAALELARGRPVTNEIGDVAARYT